MVSKCKHTKEDDQQTNIGQYLFIALLFQIQENANTTLTASKHNTSTEFLQETGSFYWHNTLMHKCPKTCQSYGMFGKSDALNAVLCFQRKFKCSPYPNSAIKLPIQPSELIKKHTHKCAIPDAGHLHEKMLQTQSISLGSAVGILVAVMELPWGLVSIGVALVPVSRIWRGPVATALGGLQCRYQ